MGVRDPCARLDRGLPRPLLGARRGDRRVRLRRGLHDLPPADPTRCPLVRGGARGGGGNRGLRLLHLPGLPRGHAAPGPVRLTPPRQRKGTKMNRSTRRRRPWLAAAALAATTALATAACGGSSTGSAEETAFQDGQVFTLVLGSSPGGGFDTQARMLQPYLDK